MGLETLSNTSKSSRAKQKMSLNSQLKICGPIFSHWPQRSPFLKSIYSYFPNNSNFILNKNSGKKRVEVKSKDLQNAEERDKNEQPKNSNSGETKRHVMKRQDIQYISMTVMQQKCNCSETIKRLPSSG